MSLYPFDPTGELNSNYIRNELTTPQAVNGSNVYLVIPTATPFYGTGFTVVGLDGVGLAVDADYQLVLPWAQGTVHTGRSVYGGLVLKGVAATHPVYLNYHTLGGEYVDSRANTIQSGLVALGSVLGLDWSTAPTIFPSTPHNEVLGSVDGVTEIINAIDRVQVALTQPLPSIHMDSIVDLDVEFIQPLLVRLQELSVAVALSRGVNDITVTHSSEIAVIQQRLDLVEAALLHANATRSGIIAPAQFTKLANL